MSTDQKILRLYDPMMRRALYEDTRNWYLTVSIYFFCALMYQYEPKKEPGFYDIVLSIPLCTKLGYSPDLPKKCYLELIRYVDEIERSKNKLNRFEDFAIHMAKYLQTLIPTFKYYIHEHGHYVTNTGDSSWSGVMGPLLWTWCHMTFANTKDIEKRKTYIGLILSLDFMIGCSFCQQHYTMHKPELVSLLSDEFSRYDAENAFLDIHTYVRISVKDQTLDARQLALAWYDIRDQARDLFRDEYRLLSSKMITE